MLERKPFSWHILQLLAMMAGGATAALGLAVIVGWHLHSETLLQLHPTYAPMQYNAALNFVLCGSGLLALTCGWSRVAAICGAVAAVIGLLTFSEYLLGINLGIDQLFVKAFLTVQTSHPGRMAPNTAVCFMLAGITLWVMSASTRHEQLFLITGPLGAIVLALGLVSCIGYLSGLETYRWGYFTSMAVHTAVGCMHAGGRADCLRMVGRCRGSGNRTTTVRSAGWYLWSDGHVLLVAGPDRARARAGQPIERACCRERAK